MLILELGSPPTPRTPWFTGSGLGRPEADFSFTAAGTKISQKTPPITYLGPVTKPSKNGQKLPESMIFIFFLNLQMI